MKEARVARGFYPVVVPIRSDQPTGRGKGDSSSVKNVSGKNCRGKGGRGRKALEDLPTLVAAAERRKAEDVQQLVMVHQVLKSVSSVVRMIIGRVIVQRWMMFVESEETKPWSPRIWCVDL